MWIHIKWETWHTLPMLLNWAIQEKFCQSCEYAWLGYNYRTCRYIRVMIVWQPKRKKREIIKPTGLFLDVYNSCSSIPSGLTWSLYNGSCFPSVCRTKGGIILHWFKGEFPATELARGLRKLAGLWSLFATLGEDALAILLQEFPSTVSSSKTIIKSRRISLTWAADKAKTQDIRTCTFIRMIFHLPSPNSQTDSRYMYVSTLQHPMAHSRQTYYAPLYFQ